MLANQANAIQLVNSSGKCKGDTGLFVGEHFCLCIIDNGFLWKPSTASCFHSDLHRALRSSARLDVERRVSITARQIVENLWVVVLH